MLIQQNMSFVKEGYASLGETLESRAAELSSSVQELKEAQKETDNMMTWLKDMKKTAASWNKAATEKDSVKTQLEQQKVQRVLLSLSKWFNYVLKLHTVLIVCFALNEITGFKQLCLFFIILGIWRWHETKAGAAPEAKRDASQLD